MDVKVNQTQALIDKVTFSNVRIEKILDMEKLIDDEVIQKKPDDPKAETEKPKEKYIQCTKNRNFNYITCGGVYNVDVYDGNRKYDTKFY